MDRGELARFLFAAEHDDHAAPAVLLGLNGRRVSEACATDIEDLACEHGHRTLRIIGKGSKPATIPLVPRTARTIDLAIGKRAGLVRVHPHMLRTAFIVAALDAGVPLREVQLAARHADPGTTTIYDRRRQNLDRHAADVVVALVTSGEPRDASWPASVAHTAD